jgi:hypothetical protein
MSEGNPIIMADMPREPPNSRLSDVSMAGLSNFFNCSDSGVVALTAVPFALPLRYPFVFPFACPFALPFEWPLAWGLPFRADPFNGFSSASSSVDDGSGVSERSRSVNIDLRVYFLRPGVSTNPGCEGLLSDACMSAIVEQRPGERVCRLRASRKLTLESCPSWSESLSPSW